jgi:hypothetical protein
MTGKQNVHDEALGLSTQDHNLSIIKKKLLDALEQ